MSTTITSTTRTQTDELRRLADWLDRHPEVKLTTRAIVHIWPAVDLDSRAAELAVLTRALADGAAPGAVVKEPGEPYMRVYRSFGPFDVTAIAPRDEVCEQVVVGTELVDQPDPDSVEAQTVVELEAALAKARAAVPIIAVETEKRKWVCEPVLSRRATREENLAGIEASKDAIANVLCSPPEATISDADDIHHAFITEPF